MSGAIYLIIAVIAIIFWHFLPEDLPEKPIPKFRREPRAIASEPNWQTFIYEHCESPAELAFLKAMIVTHNLLPENGSLKAAGLKIDFQVEVAKYRLDFLANEWLIVEIDGAAWHSSDEAKARDAARDSFFIKHGYSVVRIPAKIVFDDPSEAVRRVSTALQEGKPEFTEPIQRSGLKRLRQTATSIISFSSGINEFVARETHLRNSLSEAEQSYNSEKLVIEASVEGAERQIEIDKYLGENVERHATFYNTYDELHRAFEKYDQDNANEIARQSVIIPPFVRPAHLENAEIDQEIDNRFSRLSAERNAFFDSVRKKLQGDKRLRPLVRDNLIKFGCPQCWEHIA